MLVIQSLLCTHLQFLIGWQSSRIWDPYTVPCSVTNSVQLIWYGETNAFTRIVPYILPVAHTAVLFLP